MKHYKALHPNTHFLKFKNKTRLPVLCRSNRIANCKSTQLCFPFLSLHSFHGINKVHVFHLVTVEAFPNMLDQGLHTVVENVCKVGGHASRKGCAKWKGGQHSLEGFCLLPIRQR